MIIECKKHFRPSEVETLLRSTKARRKLNWRPEIEIKALVEDMVNEDLISLSNDKKVIKFLAGHKRFGWSAIYKPNKTGYKNILAQSKKT